MNEYNETYGKRDVETEQIKCERCGANMIFDPGTQTLYCEHCGNHREIEHDKDVREIDINKAFEEGELWNREAVVFRCDNCGAKVVLESGVVAKKCPFCGASHIMQADEMPGIKPNAVVPFAFTVQQAVERCVNWAKKKFFAPSKFKKRLDAENVSGLYFPCFTFDSRTASNYLGRLGKRYTVTVGSGKNRRTETRIRYFSVQGSYEQLFDDIMIAVSEKVNQKLMKKFLPFDMASACVYSDKYLSGYMANHYEKDVKASWQEAKDTMDAIIRRNIVSQYNADVVDYLNVSTVHNNVTYKYLLLPIYVGNYRFNKKLYNFYMNGSTGKVVGKYPVSPLRVALVSVLGAAAVGLIGWLIMRFLL